MSVSNPLEEMKYVLQNAEPSNVYASQQFASKMTRANVDFNFRDISSKFCSGSLVEEKKSNATDNALMIYTSGTTGKARRLHITKLNFLQISIWNS